MQMRLQWRHTKVLELSSQSHNQSEIARILQVVICTVIVHTDRMAEDNGSLIFYFFIFV